MSFIDAINAAVRAELTKIMDEEVKAAQERIATRMRKSADMLALQVLARYDIENQTNRLIITVKKGDAA